MPAAVTAPQDSDATGHVEAVAPRSMVVESFGLLLPTGELVCDDRVGPRLFSREADALYCCPANWRVVPVVETYVWIAPE